MRFDPVHFIPPTDALTRRRLLAIGADVIAKVAR